MSPTRRDLLRLLGSVVAVPALRRGGLAQGTPDVDLNLTAAPAAVPILGGAPTRVWRYTAELLKGPRNTITPSAGYLGPTLRFARGQRVRIRFRNRLPDPSIVHWHGLDVPETADGHPRFAVPGGDDYVYEFEVINRAGTYWYHPHPHMQTGPQVYSGLAGLLLVTDPEEAALGLPPGIEELVCVLQDRQFDTANQFVYPTAMMDRQTGALGSRVLINGVPAPTWRLGSRAYRLRFLNGSNARVYKLRWTDGTPLIVIGTDGGLLEHALSMAFVTLAPGQRLDTWLDLSGRAAGTRLTLESAEFPVRDAGLAMGMGGRGMMTPPGGVMSRGTPALPLGGRISLLSIEVGRNRVQAAPLPDRLSHFDATWAVATRAPVRRVPLTFQMMEWKLGGRTFAMGDVAPEETVASGSTHVWEFANAGGPMGMQIAHPMHVHGRQFRVLARTGGQDDNALRAGIVDAGWTDTVLVLPGETVRVQVTFGANRGLFLYHCHILEHEDMGMMRNYRVT